MFKDSELIIGGRKFPSRLFLGTGKFSSNPDVAPRKFEECKGTGDTGENSFTVYVPELLQGQIGRNDGGTSG